MILKPTVMAKTDKVLALNAQGLTWQVIAGQLGVAVASVYRTLKNQATSEKKRKASLKRCRQAEAGGTQTESCA